MGTRSGDLGGVDPLDPIEGETDYTTDEGAIGAGGIMTSQPYPAGEEAYATTTPHYAGEYASSGTIDTTNTIDTTGLTDDEIAAQREQIERTRAEMSQTLDAIQGKLSPENLTQQAKDAVKDATIGKAQEAVSGVTDSVQSTVSDMADSVQDTVSDMAGSVQNTVSGVADTAGDVGGSFIDTIRANPIPAAMAGLGIGWLIMSFRNRSSSAARRTGYRSSPYRYTAPPQYTTPPRYTTPTPEYPSGRYTSGAPYRETYGDGQAYGSGQAGYAYGSQGSESAGPMDQIQGKASDIAQQAQNTAGQVASQAQNTASQVANQVQSTASQVANQAQDTAAQLANQASQAANQAQYQVQQAGTQLDQMIQERPLAVAVGAFAVGMAVGLAIPETRREDEWMGEARETLTQRASQVVQETAQKAESVAEEAIGAAKDTAQRAAQDQGLTPEAISQAGSSSGQTADASSSSASSDRSTSTESSQSS